MSGICAIVQQKNVPVNEHTITRMLEALLHRGRDGKGVHMDGGVALGVSQLSPVELTPEARQPIRGASGLYTIVCDGTIYNHKELHGELRKHGHNFKSRSPVEVILRAYIQWGAECVNRFNGSFAFAIHDQVSRRLFFSRDRHGTKPLYYTQQQGVFLLASESKAFITHPRFTPAIDLEAVTEYFTFQNILSDRTFFQGVQLVPAGHWGIVSLTDGCALQIKQFWDYNFAEETAWNDEEACREELDRLFVQAVSRQLDTEAEVGAYLSGGMDSGSITAVAAKQIPYIKTFTCGFDLHSASGLELAFDERRSAELMSYLFKTEHYEMVLKAGDMERVLPKITWHIEEPRVGQSYPNYCAAHLASRFVKIVLAGSGGDELFGGYPWRYYRTVGSTSFDDYIDRYYLFWQRLIPNKDLQRMLRPVWNDIKHVWTRDIFRNVFGSNVSVPETPAECVNRSLYFEAKTFMHGLLVVDDKLAMGNGLETRMPFLDNDLVEFAQKVPVRFKLSKLDEVTRVSENNPGKLKEYFLKTNDGKRLLRSTMERYIPSQVTDALKQGFSAPDASWFKGESIDYVRKILFSNDARIYTYFDRNEVQAQVQEHLDGKTNKRLFIWSLLTFEWWLKTYLP